MPKRSTLHHHILLDWRGQTQLASIEHDHRSHVGVRHAHYWEREQVYRDLRAAGELEAAARAKSEIIDGRPQTTLSFTELPKLLPAEGQDQAREVWTPRRPD